jgi:hypothetical protein
MSIKIKDVEIEAKKGRKYIYRMWWLLGFDPRSVHVVFVKKKWYWGSLSASTSVFFFLWRYSPHLGLGLPP